MRAALLLLCLMGSVASVAGREEVVLLHGLARTSRSMGKLERALEAEGYAVLNIGYPSRSKRVQELALAVRREIEERRRPGGVVHVVTHSMGGIVLRQMQKTDPLPGLGRVVMIAPPNRGSEVVDALGDWWLFKAVNGPAGQQLGTAPDGFVAGLGPVGFELGVVAGNRSLDPVLSRLIPGESDGKVAVERTKVEGMSDFLVVGRGHTSIMRKPEVIEATVRFLRQGNF